MNYQEYLQSYEWKRVRERCLRRWEYRCAICNSKERLQVHHRTYENLGQERDTDVIALCDACHELFSHRMQRRFDWLGRVASKIFDYIDG